MGGGSKGEALLQAGFLCFESKCPDAPGLTSPTRYLDQNSPPMLTMPRGTAVVKAWLRVMSMKPRQLRELKASDLIEHTAYPQVAPKVTR